MTRHPIIVMTAFSQNIAPLYKRWYASLPDMFVPSVKYIHSITKNCSHGFQKQTWYDAIEMKIAHFIHTMEQYPDDTIFVCSDADIVFIDTRQSTQPNVLYNYITHTLYAKKLDMLFLGEGHHDDKVNGGFYAVRNSQRVRDIMRKAKEHCKKKTPYADQDFYNSDEFQKDPNIKWAIIDRKYVAWGTIVFAPLHTLFHHAVCAKNMEEKLLQQTTVLRVIREAQAMQSKPIHSMRKLFK